MKFSNFFVWVWLLFCTALAQATPTDLDNQRLRDIAATVRCLVCQNQNLLDSDAPLAKDLRDQIMVMINNEQTDLQITDYLTQRYGDFVLYTPPFKASTWVLWLGPVLFIAITLFALGRTLARTRNEVPTTHSKGESTCSD